MRQHASTITREDYNGTISKVLPRFVALHLTIVLNVPREAVVPPVDLADAAPLYLDRGEVRRSRRRDAAESASPPVAHLAPLAAADATESSLRGSGNLCLRRSWRQMQRTRPPF